MAKQLKKMKGLFCYFPGDFLELLEVDSASENVSDGALRCGVSSAALPNCFSHTMKHLSVSKSSCLLSSTTCSLLDLGQIGVRRSRYVLCWCPQSRFYILPGIWDNVSLSIPVHLQTCYWKWVNSFRKLL